MLVDLFAIAFCFAVLGIMHFEKITKVAGSPVLQDGEE